MIKDVYLSLGSNLGDREQNLNRAISLLEQKLSAKADAVSAFVNTEALGFDGPDFLNCVVRFRVDIEPVVLLEICKLTEVEMGRKGVPEFDAGGNRIYCSRPIDVDIVLFGKDEINLPGLVVPHPKMKERRFVMEPLEQIFRVND